jgi:spore germination cell wall hydrolase CwlJ-like protein
MSKALKARLIFVFLSFALIFVPMINASGKESDDTSSYKSSDDDENFDGETKNLVLTLRDTVKDLIKKSKNKEQIVCIAKNVYHESRNQPYIGQLAVAQVTLNRSKYKNSKPCKVVYKRNGNGCQFSWVCDGIPDNEGEHTAWKEALAIAYASYNNMIGDPTNGATYYYNPKIAHPRWARKFQVVAIIGDHKFLKEYTVLAESYQ